MVQKKERDMGIIIINGKRYDSVTGLMVSENKPAADTINSRPVNKSASRPVSRPAIQSAPAINKTIDSSDQVPAWINSYIDEAPHSSTDDIVKKSAAAAPVAAAKTHAATRPQPAPMHARHTVDPSRTLNRRFVRKPLSENGNYAESLAAKHLEQAAAARQVVAPINIPEETQLHAAMDTNRDFVPLLTRRQAEGLSQLTRRFIAPQQLASQPAAANEQSIPVNHTASPAKFTSVWTSGQAATQSTQVTAAVRPVAPRPVANITKPTGNRYDDETLFDDQLEQLSKVLQNAQAVDQEQNQPQNRSQRQVASSNSTSQSNRRDRKAAKAKAKAAKRSQRQANKQTRRRFRAPAIMATAGAMAAIVGIGVYIAMPTVSIKIAANKAGIDAKNPYVPSGYTIDGKVAYQSGRITINYRSKSGSDGYSVTQESSNSMSDAALKREVSAKNDGYYQEVEIGDTNVYMYRDIVSWLNGGIKYTINSNDYLDSEQISDIVKSL